MALSRYPATPAPGASRTVAASPGQHAVPMPHGMGERIAGVAGRAEPQTGSLERPQ